MELYAQVTYTAKAHRTLTGITLIKRGNPTTAIVFRTILSLFILAAAIFMPLEEMPILNGILKICAIVLTVCMALILAQYIFLPMSRAKKARKESHSPISYRFSEELFTVDATANGAAEHYERRYDTLDRVIETEDYFFLFLNKASAFIVEKAALTGGTSAELREKLRLYVPKYQTR